MHIYIYIYICICSTSAIITGLFAPTLAVVSSARPTLEPCTVGTRRWSCPDRGPHASTLEAQEPMRLPQQLLRPLMALGSELPGPDHLVGQEQAEQSLGRLG